jgi:integrase
MLGLRPGEVLGFPWSAVELDEATMEIRQTLKRLPDGRHVIGPPKVNSYRKVRIPDQLVLALRAHRQTQRKLRLSAPVWENNDLVFPNSIGRRMDFLQLSTPCNALCKGGGIGSRTDTKSDP